MYRSGLVDTLFTHANTNGVWPNSLVRRLPWQKQNKTMFVSLVFHFFPPCLLTGMFTYYANMFLAFLTTAPSERIQSHCTADSKEKPVGRKVDMRCFLVFPSWNRYVIDLLWYTYIKSNVSRRTWLVKFSMAVCMQYVASHLFYGEI
jgi:hypothetical protein